LPGRPDRKAHWSIPYEDHLRVARQETGITDLNEALVKELSEKITIFADHFTVEFKSGLSIEIKA